MFLITVIKMLSSLASHWHKGLKTAHSMKNIIVDSSASKQVFFFIAFSSVFSLKEQVKGYLRLISDCSCIYPNLYL